MLVRRVVVASAVVCLVASSLAASGCKRIETALTPEPEIITQEATVAASSAQVEGELPGDAPGGVPMWPGATVDAAEVSKDGSYSLVLVSDEAYDDVVAGVSVGLERAGWEVAEAANEADAVVLDAGGSGLVGVITITRTESGGATIEYLLTPAE